jgi:predicted RND superfamily exporter protein
MAMVNRLFDYYDKYILAYPRTVLMVLLLIIAGLGSYMPTFKLDASADALVLEGDDDLEFFREIGKRYASEDFLIVTYSPEKDLYSDETLKAIEALREELAALEPVSSVTTVLDVPLLQSPPLAMNQLSDGIKTLRDPAVDRELVREEFKTSPIYRDLLVSRDASTTALQVNIKRDQRYIELLERRERLAEILKSDTASSADRENYDIAFHEFRDYATTYNETMSAFIEEVRGILAGHRGEAVIYLGGVPMIAADMISFVKSDLSVFGIGIVLMMLLMLTYIFRSVRWVMLPLLSCVLTCVAMLGYLALIDWRMTVVSSNFVALLLIITLSINIHLVVRYREFNAADRGKTQRELVSETIRFMFKPCLYTALTTTVAFASLVVSGIRPVIDFGWMMTLGIFVAMFLSFLIFPCILVLLPRREHVPTGSSFSGFTLRFASFTEKRGTTVILASLALAALAAYGISRLEVENRFIDFFDKSTEIYQGMELIDARLGGTIPMEIIIKADTAEAELDDEDNEFSDDLDEFADEEADDFSDDDFAEDEFADEFAESGEGQPSPWFNRAGLRRIEQVHDYLESLPETGKVISLATFYEVMQQLSGGGVDDIQLAIAQRSLPESISSAMIDPYLKDEFAETRISARVMETSRSLKRNEYLQQVRDHLINELGFKEENVRITGMLVLYNNMLQSLYRSQILTLAAVFVAIMVMFILLFRSFKLAVIGIIPNILAAGVVLGGMGLAGVPLDMMTITIAAITIGIGVDDTIHYIHRFKREFAVDGDYIATMYRCHASIGKAMYYTSATIILGFSVLALSNFTPSIFFGVLTGVAMLAALLGALTLLPQLIVAMKPLD